MSDKLVKEIITTTTERFGDSGRIKEKITESREKVYSTLFSEEQIKNAEPIENRTEQVEQAEKSNEELIQEAAKKIDSDAQQQGNAFAPSTAQGAQPAPQGGIPQYNVASRTPLNSAAMPNTAKFPWER